MVLGVNDVKTMYDTEQALIKRIMDINIAQAKKKGIPESTLMDWKK